jgi:hypothetical protein
MEKLPRIKSIVKDNKLSLIWEKLNPIIFYKDGEPYGLISVLPYRNGVLINSCSKDKGKFTKEMIKHIQSIVFTCKSYISHNNGYEFQSDMVIKTAKRLGLKAYKITIKNQPVTVIQPVTGTKRGEKCQTL